MASGASGGTDGADASLHLPNPVPEGAGVVRAGDEDVAGRVVADDGTSVVGAVVTAYDEATGVRLAGTGTNRQGRFWIRLPYPVAQVRLQVTADRAEGALAPLAVDAVGTGRDDLLVELWPGAVVTGRVVDAEGRGVVASVHDVVSGTSTAPPAWRPPAARDETAGRFRLLVQAGTCRLFAQPRADADLAVSPVVAIGAPASDGRLVCPAAPTVEGRLAGEDVGWFSVAWIAPLPNGDVATRWTRTEEDGRFTLRGAPQGVGTLAASRPDDDRFALRSFDAPPDGMLDVPLVRGLTIAGVIRGRRGTFLASDRASRTRIRASRRGWDYAWETRAQADGAFALRGLPPGVYDVTADTQGTASRPARDVEAGSQSLVLIVE